MDCFRMCDVRGIYPDELDETLFYRLGLTIGSRYACDTPVLLGCDTRLSSPALKRALAHGLAESGAPVLDAGQVPTPVVYFGKRARDLTVAAIVTASHNPPRYNGLNLLLAYCAAKP